MDRNRRYQRNKCLDCGTATRLESCVMLGSEFQLIFDTTAHAYMTVYTHLKLLQACGKFWVMPTWVRGLQCSDSHAIFYD